MQAISQARRNFERQNLKKCLSRALVLNHIATVSEDLKRSGYEEIQFNVFKCTNHLYENYISKKIVDHNQSSNYFLHVSREYYLSHNTIKLCLIPNTFLGLLMNIQCKQILCNHTRFVNLADLSSNIFFQDYISCMNESFFMYVQDMSQPSRFSSL